MKEIEELRAKAIASMTSSTNPNPSSSSSAAAAAATAAAATAAAATATGLKKKSPVPREEGEVSSGEDAELATCSVAPKSTYSGESLPNTSSNSLQNIRAVRSTDRLNPAVMQHRPAVTQHYQKINPKHFKRKQMPFRPGSNQALHWHANESNNNLIISFSDDDSGSESKESDPKRKGNKKMNASVADISKIATASGHKQLNRIEQEPRVIQPLLQKGFAIQSTISLACSDREASCMPQGTSAENSSLLHKQGSILKTSRIQEHGHAQDSNMAGEKLEILRSQIALHENELQELNKSVMPKGAAGGSDFDLHALYSGKPEGQTNGIRRHDDHTIVVTGVCEPSKKRMKLDESSSDRTFHVDNSVSYQQYKKGGLMNSFVAENKKESLVQSATISENDTIVARNMIYPRQSKRNEVSNLPPKSLDSMHVTVTIQQPATTTDVGMSSEIFSILQKSSACRLGNKEENILGQRSMHFHSLAKLEELHNKELEEAQEHRRKCELEERCALNAYREAQRALIEASERCSFLYRKRESFSAKLRDLVMEASIPMWPPNWHRKQIHHEDHFCEPDASTSVRRDDNALDGVVHHIQSPNVSTDDEGNDYLSNDRCIESRCADVNMEIGKAPHLDDYQDYELLEASLRSKLVARLGVRASHKVDDTNKEELCADKRGGSIGDDAEPSANQQMQDKKQNTNLEGIERPKQNSHELSGHLDHQLHVDDFSLFEGLHSSGDMDDNDCFPIVSGNPICSEVLSVLSSDLHIVFRHSDLFVCGCPVAFFNMKESALMMLKDNFNVNRISDIKEIMDMMRSIPTGCKVLCGSSIEVEPFWPLCMYELRGRCNDEECPWQHIKRADHVDHLPNGKSENTSSFPLGVLHHSLPIPIYHIGSYLIKADSHLSHSVLARSIWQYGQRGFCASFSLPFSVHRVLPSDAPCLQPGDDPVADSHSSNRLSLCTKSQDGKMSYKGRGDIDQILEMALDHFEGKFCEPDRKKALSLLARAIEAYPSAVVLWVVYLHIYYRKEKLIGKDDMFLHAVQNNKGSYELWLMYINSRMLSDDRLKAYDKALSILCEVGDEMADFSACVLDIFLQMIDFLCMSGQVEKAVSRICGLLSPTVFGNHSGNSLPDILSKLTVSDRCLLWTCCVYFLVYETLPDAIIEEFELVKDLTVVFNWPSSQVVSGRKELALEFMELAVSEMILLLDDSSVEKHQSDYRSLHFLAMNHVKCVAVLNGSLSFSELLDKYLKLYPSCIELVLLAIRSSQIVTDDLHFQAFEETLNNWPKESYGIQCLWNQYAEYALTNGRADFTVKLMARWYQDFSNFWDLHSFPSENGRINTTTNDDTFGILNLCLYLVLQKNMEGARTAIDKALEIAAPEDYKHFAKEHAAFFVSSNLESLRHFPFGLYRLLNCYLSDHRSSLGLQPLSRRFTRTIKKPRILQMVNNILGPVSRDTSLLNSVLEICYGPSLLPEKSIKVKDVVGFVDLLMEIMPANYVLALAVCRILSRNFSRTIPECNSLRFWASTLLVNSIFHAVPVAPEHIWLEASNILHDFENADASLRFHKQALLVYPFSLKLWKSYANTCTNSGHANEIVEAARERGIELSINVH